MSKTKYNQDEVPEHSILRESHDLGHLVKNIEAKPIKRSSLFKENKNDEEDMSTSGGVRDNFYSYGVFSYF